MNKLRYFIYARKSSEDKKKQIASIPAQVKELNEIATKEKLTIIDVLSEERSAKAPGRDVFTEMVERIHKGEANAILCWKLDRLSRNPVDGGTISWLLQQGIVQNIKTFTRDYYPTDNVLMMQVELGMANQFIRDLSENTKRGLRKRVADGWYPSKAPIGYLNAEGKSRTRIIIDDAEKRPIAERIFRLFLEGTYTVGGLRKIAVDQYGLRSVHGTKLSNSSIHRMLSNPFYAGKFTHQGKEYKGKHNALITEREHERILKLLGNDSKDKIRPQKHFHAYTGFIKCGECGCSITADPVRVRKSKNGNVRSYKYYHCTKKSEKDCSQGSIEEREMERQIEDMIKDIDLPESVVEWAIKQVKEEKDIKITKSEKLIKSTQQTYNACLNKISKLVDKNLEGSVDDELYEKKMKEYKIEKTKLKKSLDDMDLSFTEKIEVLEKGFNFSKNLHISWEKAPPKDKRQLLYNLGSNLLLKDAKISLDLDPVLSLVKKNRKGLLQINDRLEPVNTLIKTGGLETEEVLYSVWGD